MYNVIVNPSSKSGLGIKEWHLIEPVLKQKNIEYKAFITQKNGDAEAFAKALTSSDNECRLIVLGGDGTMNELLQGIQNFERVTIGYIPAGSSNDLARDLKICSSPLKRLEQILSEENIVLKDIGELTYNNYDTDSLRLPLKEFKTTRRFSVSAGIGFDAAVCAGANISRSKTLLNRFHLGKLIYLFIALRQILTVKRSDAELTIDNNSPIKLKKMLFTASMIHKYEGGGFMFCPHASYSDGLLDLCVAGSIPTLKILIALPTAFKGWHFHFKNITEHRAGSVRIKTSVPLWVHTDGEVAVKSSDISVCCNKYNVRFIV